MPFTIAHAAAVLPLRRLSRVQLPLAALMIGSMSPDFSYFLPGDLSRLATHSVSGLCWFCWPAGLVLWLLFVKLLEGPSIALLPQTWRPRVERSHQTISLRALALASTAIVLGAATHVVWDSFTHRGSAVVVALPVLRVEVFQLAGHPIRLYKFLQHLSSVFGMAVLALWWLRPGVPASPLQVGEAVQAARQPSTRMRLGALLVLLITSCAVGFTKMSWHSGVGLERRLFHFAIGAMTGWMVAWCAIALWMRWGKSKAH